MMRTPLIVGNWKMHKTGKEAQEFIHALCLHIPSQKRRIFLAVPFTAIERAVQAASGPILIGAQNMHDEKQGSFTGEISARMLKAAGAQFVILGHSERRELFNESNAFINRKLHHAISQSLTPILCIGESLKERQENRTQQILNKQLEECLKAVDETLISQIIIAYEPIWAIGTGKTATPQIAQQTLHMIRSFIAYKYGKKAADELSLLYGGSIKPDNIADIMKEVDIDGVLVGGASLEIESFVRIINY